MNKLALFFIICMSQLFADLIHPPNVSELSYIHVLFRWDAETDVASYTFELSSSSNFASLLISENIADTIYLELKKILLKELHPNSN